ncbi:MAG: RNA methyltransferase [Rhodothermaceae bacterium]|nr:RNA methyltransferase [Rhodothermaceae bacterium]
MHVFSLSERLRKETASLNKRKGREALRQFLIEGVRSVEAAVVGGAQLVRVLVNDRMLEDERVARLLERTEASVHSMTDKQERTITTVDTSPGCIAVAEYKSESLETILSLQSVIVLDGVQDPGNVGTIIRTASWFGIDAVMLGSGSVDIYHPKTVRSTMGGLWDSCCVRVDDIADSLSVLKSRGFTLYGTFLDGVSLPTWQPVEKAAVVIGSEARGISNEVETLIDQRISIPGQDHNRATESLNAATAASICMYAYASSMQAAGRVG